VTDTTVIDLRNAIFDRLTADAFPYASDYVTTRKTPLPSLQSDQLPALSVFILGGDASPDGDGNVANIRLVNDETIAISIARGLDDPAVLEGNIDAELEAIKTTLFTDPTFVRFGDGFLFEALVRTRRRWLFPRDGDEYRIELQYELTFRKREIFEPIIGDAFERATLTTRQAGADPNSPAITTVVLEAQ
jgi:hypothetical protein